MEHQEENGQQLVAAAHDHVAKLEAEIAQRAVPEAAALLAPQPDEVIVRVLADLNPGTAVAILWTWAPALRERILAHAPAERREQWIRNQAYPEGSIGRLMDHPLAVFRPSVTVGAAIEELRTLVKRHFITYAFVTDEADVLQGVLVFRDLLYADPLQRLDEVMVANPFALDPSAPLDVAMRGVLRRHYPVYPVTDPEGHLVGIVRGQMLFAQRAFDLTAQAGSMVGVEKEERLATPWSRSLLMRHPWLQLNLLTAFIAAAVVGVFEETIDKIVVLAVFLPVLAGQSGNTGCQALAVTLRGLTLGDLKPERTRSLLVKETWLGFLNGSLVGITAGLGMLGLAWSQGNPDKWWLALVVWIAMIGSCTASGLAGAVVPLTLKRLGADPATASSIFLTTATDVASMGLFLGLATILIR